jgi:hypothetical protein
MIAINLLLKFTILVRCIKFLRKSEKKNELFQEDRMLMPIKKIKIIWQINNINNNIYFIKKFSKDNYILYKLKTI